ncbi:MAG: PIN domain-containing protein [Methylobacter sp.]
MSKYFLDTNIILYAYSNSEPLKADKANALIFEGESIISLQVINEFVNVCLKKLRLKENAVSAAILEITSATHVVGFSLSTQLQALQLCQFHSFSYYDALITATAVENDCTILYSEDMQHHQLIDKQLRIVNPFQ